MKIALIIVVLSAFIGIVAGTLAAWSMNYAFEHAGIYQRLHP